MSAFTLPLELSPGDEDDLWRTTRPLPYEIGRKGSGLLVAVPEGFATDLGSVPAVFRWLINPADAYCAAAFVLHDFLCADLAFTRTVTDAVLFEALIALGVPLWKARVIHFGVSAFRIFRGRI